MKPVPAYAPLLTRYETMPYARTGKSGLLLPRLALGLWQNFGDVDLYPTGRSTVLRAFDLGITHFDLANNYGPPPGTAESNFGRMLRSDLAPFRDELIIATKAGYRMWPGPYGDLGSRKYLLASLDQSLKRMGLDYVDIFYSHRPDPATPLEETMGALAHAVRSGKALYVGLSNYSPEQTTRAAAILRDLGTPCLIHQFCAHMFNRGPETSLLPVLKDEGIGGIVFSPLAQGLLTTRYLNGVPADSRVGRGAESTKWIQLTDARIAQVRALHELAQKGGRSVAQLAIHWLMRHDTVTSVLIGASSPAQLNENAQGIESYQLTAEELAEIEKILASS
ncbi:L-glyceraldehyde 3-phosphate reductase [Verrucomicrobia bacterium LW23]|nr:L-glyceraldehyde 3-phosphate reductase [Verrucomicrobia bacterium LW23]